MQQASRILAAGLIIAIATSAAFAGPPADVSKQAGSDARSQTREWRLPAMPDFSVELWDGEHYLRIVEIDHARTLLAEGPDGSLIYEGPVDTDKQRASVDPVVRRKMDQVMELPGVLIFIDTAGSSVIEASFDDHWPEGGEDALAVCTHERLVYDGLTDGPDGRPLHAMHRLIDHRLIYEQSIRRIEVTVPEQELLLVPAETF